MKYIDTGSRDSTDTLGTWLQKSVLKDVSVTELRWQSGYFSADVLPYFAPAMARLEKLGQTVRVLVGSNDGNTRRVDVEALLKAAGSARPKLRVGVVSFVGGYFHPKTVHLVRNDKSTAAYVGSANLTKAGVTKNVEAGVIFDTRQGDDHKTLNAIRDAIDDWFTHPRKGLYIVQTAADLIPLVGNRVLDVPVPRKERSSSGALGNTRGPFLKPLHSLPAAFQLIPASPPSLPNGASASLAIQWTKKLTASDAQRKRRGNQRGGITFVKAGAAINSRSYFRKTLFGAVPWKKEVTSTGKPVEIAQVIFNVNLFGKQIGPKIMEVSHALNRESGQSNYTSLLHLGPLTHFFNARNMTGRQLTIVRQPNGSYDLSIR